MSTLVPSFRVLAIFLDKKEELVDGQKTGKIVLNFATDAINKHFSRKTFIDSRLTAQLGGCLQTKISQDIFLKYKHLLREDTEVLLTVCPASWSSNGNSGTWFDFIELESTAQLPSIV